MNRTQSNNQNAAVETSPAARREIEMVTYTCPKCRAYMVPVSSRSMPATRHYRCVGCGYTSRTEQVKDYVLELPRELWRDDGKEADACTSAFTVAAAQ